MAEQKQSPRFYVAGPLRAGGAAELSEDAAHHAVHVLRIRQDEPVVLFDGRGGEHDARIASMDRLRVRLDVLGHRDVERELPLRVGLVQGLSSGERMDFTVRKAVELGVAEIWPVLAESSVARPKGERAASRLEHWRRVVISACEQCGRNRLPVVHPISPAKDYRDDSAALKLLLSPRSDLRFSAAVKSGKEQVLIAAGPEAGFSADEEAAFLHAGFVPVRLGARVLRTETAALAALAAMQALWGDF
ncbi:MAG: 16S rRNA (uracil(1498)-N(3))-methyltransferase [Betaproteobacteria bacterium]